MSYDLPGSGYTRALRGGSQDITVRSLSWYHPGEANVRKYSNTADDAVIAIAES